MTRARSTDAQTPGVGGAQEAKTSFDEIYDQPDPRAFFRSLRRWEYQTPHHAQEVFRRVVTDCARTARAGEPVTVLDICCSYGINAALLNHDLTLEDLYAHYTSPQAAALTTAELIERDRSYYAAHRRPDAARVIGLDPAANAIAYARAVGLLDEGFAENLETVPATAALLRATHHTRLITITGGASFLSHRTFQALLAGTREPVWVAAFVLRTDSYQPIAEALTPYGLITEKATTPTFPQRRFTSANEQQYAIAAVTAAGEDPRGKETDGYFHTALHLSRPPEDATALPLTTLLRIP
ncbi:hypothetical protein [Kitasatospora sp. MAP5-34]|uniref:hypothetical protein n=1 Tax=Kitasatospora sp. MAP5-34 TaxID=3035102 RepID=UPI0024732B32|nr:hypothetical protein [Kitasatospora sp. MAP5-34]MDH6580672.1 SAM-dependent methyltransferase [Kitasatospora sp. MAP5-34]